MTSNKITQGAGRKKTLLDLADDWNPFQSRLTKILLTLEADQYLILSVKRTHRYVQFARQGSFSMRVETVSNQYLPAVEHLNRKQMIDLRKIGWNKPTGSARQSTPKKDPDGSPNYYVDFPAPVSAEQIAALTVSTFAEIHGAPYPGELVYEAFGEEGNPLDFPELGLERKIPDTSKNVTTNQDVLKNRLRTTLRALTGIAELDFDDDGDIGVRYGSMIAFARLVEEGPTIHVFAPLVQKISTNLSVVEKLNEMNAKNLQLRLFFVDDTVYAATEIPALPYIDDLVAREFNRFCKTADDLDNLLQGEFGGRTAFYEWIPSSARH